ncbi:MAG TPA: hypothetical protein VGK74_02520 [Symbiobacteriaceae bacterium]|jgi:hypothetical protein
MTDSQQFASWMKSLFDKPDTPAMMLRSAPKALLDGAGVERPNGPAHLYAPHKRAQ